MDRILREFLETWDLLSLSLQWITTRLNLYGKLERSETIDRHILKKVTTGKKLCHRTDRQRKTLCYDSTNNDKKKSKDVQGIKETYKLPYEKAGKLNYQLENKL